MQKKLYLTVDTETATVPFINDCVTTANDIRKIAIAKPLVYDIGWTISDRNGKICKTANYLVQETFFVPSIFNTAYYKSKRPLYMELLKTGKIKAMLWNDIMEEFVNDLNKCDIATAYNACFDFKKAIPYTDRYIQALYSDDYHKWEYKEKQSIKAILENSGNKNEDYLIPHFTIRDKDFPIADLWSLATEKLINNKRYKNFCIDNELVTASTEFFSTSAETVYRYISKNSDFIESHTALDDSLIESQILTKILRKGKIEPTIQPFPFRNLNTTFEYVENNLEQKAKIASMLKKYIKANDGFSKAEGGKPYWKRMVREYESLTNDKE